MVKVILSNRRNLALVMALPLILATIFLTNTSPQDGGQIETIISALLHQILCTDPELEKSEFGLPNIADTFGSIPVLITKEVVDIEL